jgi:DNA-binding FadR family transcriptional regulator
MQAVLEAMEAVRGKPERYLTLEVEFHDHVMRMSGNDVGRAVVTSIHDHARLSNRYSGGELERQIVAAHAGHVEIAQAITEADESAARPAMRAHSLTGAWSARGRPRRP